MLAGPGDPLGLSWQARIEQRVSCLAADSGARRGELAALRLSDLDGRLLVSSFLLMDSVLAMRIGSVPYWALFGTRPSLDRLAGYLSRAARYDDIALTSFPHGVESAGLPGIGEWQAVLGHARRLGQLLAVDPGRYPRHFRALTGFHRELSRLPRVPAVPSFGWDTARHYLAPHHVAFG
jgi:hypothetical protein